MMWDELGGLRQARYRWKWGCFGKILSEHSASLHQAEIEHLSTSIDFN